MNEVCKLVEALYEAGTGSHDTINGKRVECLSMWECKFSVDGVKTYGVHDTCLEITK